MTERLSKRMASALRQLAGDTSQPRPWGGTLEALEMRGLVTRPPHNLFDAKLTPEGMAAAAALPTEGDILPPETGDEWWRPDRCLQGRERNDAWARSFSVAWCAGIAAIITAGQILSALKVEIGDGQWTAFVERDTPVSLRTAQQLMRIAIDQNIARYQRIDASHDSRRLLPDDRRALTEICGMEPAEFDNLVDEGVIHAEMRRGDVRRHRVASSQPEPAPLEAATGKYGAILADPAWPFDTWTNAGKYKSPENHYPVLPVGDIAGLPVADLAADDCLLFLWVPSNHLHHVDYVMRSWGFAWRSTAFVWVKKGGLGLGYWTRKQSELCMLGVKGSPKRRSNDVGEVIIEPRGRHSEKPAQIRDRIVRLVAGPYLELFARETAPGWDSWGHLEGGGNLT